MPSLPFSPASDVNGSLATSQPFDGVNYRQPSTGWTFLTNHTHVLILLFQHPTIVLREVAVRVGLTERAVQRIIQELEQDGFIVREKVGRQNHYQVKGDKHLRHPIAGHCSIQQLLDLIGKMNDNAEAVKDTQLV